MTKTLIALAILALIIYYVYQKQAKPTLNQDSWIWASEENFSDFDYQKEQKELSKNSEEIEDLTLERDEAIRSKNEAQQEALSYNNKLKLKHQEVTSKDQEIARLKKEASQKNGLINTLQKEINQHKVKHTEQLRKINLLFDANAKDYPEIDFEGLYSLLRKKASASHE